MKVVVSVPMMEDMLEIWTMAAVTAQGCWGRQVTGEEAQGYWGRQVTGEEAQGYWGRQVTGEEAQGYWGRQVTGEHVEAAVMDSTGEL